MTYFLQIMAFDLQTSMMVLQSDINQVVCTNLKNIKYINAEETDTNKYELEFKSKKMFFFVKITFKKTVKILRFFSRRSFGAETA